MQLKNIKNWWIYVDLYTKESLWKLPQCSKFRKTNFKFFWQCNRYRFSKNPAKKEPRDIKLEAEVLSQKIAPKSGL